MISRRHFFATLEAGIIVPQVVFGSKARFTLGIGTYTYGGLTEEKMIEDLAALKIKQIELSSPKYFLPAVGRVRETTQG